MILLPGGNYFGAGGELCLQHMRTDGLRHGSVPEVCMIFSYLPSPGTQTLTGASPFKMMGEIIINELIGKAKAGRFQNRECPQRPSTINPSRVV